MRQQIIEQLIHIEQKRQVKILYACESGSRAWGFASTDSDWDVRFLYIHNIDWYLSINIDKKRDVIELPIVNELDFSGWDLRKALRLFYKSNPPLIEWLHSPIVYRDEAGLADRLRSMLDEFYSPRSCFYHYLHMARGNYREYLKGDRVWLKKYLYVLRPILALQWMEQSTSPVPVRFVELLDATLPSGNIREAIDRLLIQKQQGMEKKHGASIPEINEFLENEIMRLKGQVNKQNKTRPSMPRLNAFFREMVHSCSEAGI